MWWKDNEKNISPLVIGGLGGSGTRVIAQLVNDLGFYLGSHLNEPLDNLWFTFFLRRPKSFNSFDDKKITQSVFLFDLTMKNKMPINARTKIKLYKIAFEFIVYNYVKGKERFHFPIRCIRSIENQKEDFNYNYWGWKEPNSHLFIPQLSIQYPNMKYIHVIRHPLDIMYGTNFIQLFNWHYLFNIENPNEKNKRLLMLEYYDKANERAINIGKEILKDNFLLLRYEDLIEKKYSTIQSIVKFLNIEFDDSKNISLLNIPFTIIKRYNENQYKSMLNDSLVKLMNKYDYK